jgi:poly(A) polymerase Pap1
MVIGPAYPTACANRLISQKTDLVMGRPWRLAGALVEGADEL